MALTTDEAHVILKIDGEQAIQKINELDNKAKKLRNDFADALKRGDTSGVQKITKELNKTNAEMSKMRTNAANIEAAMRHLSTATPRQLQQTISAINRELNSGAVPRGSQAWKEYTQKLKLVRGELAKINMEQQATQSGLSRFNGLVSKWGNAFLGVTAVITGGTMSLSKMRKDFREKEASAANLKALTGLDDNNIAWLTKQAETLSQTMDKTGLRVTQSSQEILDAYMLVGSNKPELLTDKEALNAVTVETMRLSQAAKMDLKEAVKATTTALNQYGAGADEAAKYVNVLAAGSKYGSSNVQEQSAAILKAGTSAAASKIPIEQLVGAIETLGEKGMKSEIAGTGLKRVFNALGTGAIETNPKVVGLSQAIKNLKKQVDIAEKQEVGGGAKLLLKRFGERGYNVAQILTDNAAKFDYYTKCVTGSNIAVEQAAINSATAEAKMAQLKNSVKEAGIKIIQELNPSLGIMANWLSRLILQMPAVIKFIKEYGKYIAYTATVVSAYVVGLKLQAAWSKIIAAAIKANLSLQKASTAETLKAIVADKAQKIWWGIKTVAVGAYDTAIGLLTGHIKKAKQGLQEINMVLKANPWGIVLSLVVAVAGAIYLLSKRTDAEAEAEKKLNKIRVDAAQKVVEEKTKIDILVAAAKNETLSLKDRHIAIDKLNKIIPNYNAQLDNTSGKYRENKKALDSYLVSLQRQYEIEGAKEALVNLGKERAEKVIKLEKIKGTYNKAKKDYQNISYQSYGSSITGSTTSSYQMANTAIRSMKNDIDKWNREISDIEKQEGIITHAYGADMQKSAINEPQQVGATSGMPSGGGGGSLTPKQQAAIDKAARARERAKAKAEAKAKKEIQAELKNTKGWFEDENSEITANAAIGNFSYVQTLEKRYDADKKYIEKKKAIYEKHNMRESEEYKKLLNEEEELKAKQIEAETTLTEAELDRKQKLREDDVINTFFDTNSPFFQNEKVRDEQLFRINIEFLTKKRNLYKKDSKEWLDYQNQIDDADRENKLTKQKNYAEKVADLRKGYEKQDSQTQKDMELATLDEVYKAGLIKKEEYEKLRKAIEDKYRNGKGNDIKNSDNGYGDTISELVKDIQTFGDPIEGAVNSTDKLAGKLGKLGKIGAAAWSIIGGAMQSYSEYSRVCADIEIARTQKKYEKMIEAAGNNSAESKRLQDKEQKEITKIKKKANDRAMKIELAQAVASAAMAAINAYASAAAIPKIGWILGPIAAGLALAASAVQIATIRKSHQAEAEGYYSGGFTRKTLDDKQEVGVVHANEFVANAEAVKNPALSPMLHFIDFAQRNNRVGSITAEDVSRAIGSSAVIPSQSVAVPSAPPASAGLILSNSENSETAEAVKRLNEHLDKGIEAYVVLDGERGLDAKYNHFKKLKQNTQR